MTRSLVYSLLSASWMCSFSPMIIFTPYHLCCNYAPATRITHRRNIDNIFYFVTINRYINTCIAKFVRTVWKLSILNLMLCSVSKSCCNCQAQFRLTISSLTLPQTALLSWQFMVGWGGVGWGAKTSLLSMGVRPGLFNYFVWILTQTKPERNNKE